MVEGPGLTVQGLGLSATHRNESAWFGLQEANPYFLVAVGSADEASILGFVNGTLSKSDTLTHDSNLSREPSTLNPQLCFRKAPHALTARSSLNLNNRHVVPRSRWPPSLHPFCCDRREIQVPHQTMWKQIDLDFFQINFCNRKFLEVTIDFSETIRDVKIFPSLKTDLYIDYFQIGMYSVESVQPKPS